MAPVPTSRILAPLAILVLCGTLLAGCIGDDAPAPTTASAWAPTLDYAPVKEENLSEPTFGILEAIDTRVAASTDGISLFAEVYLPDGEGPWPTILHSTPYKHLDKAISSVFGSSLVNFYVPRGYAVVLADVRGFGDSEGCVEVWGKKEQQDQYDLVEWIAEQEWADGKVGMIGASYPGTTPIEAAIMTPPHLVTIVAAAGLTDPYFDWHYGGVPTGESGPVGSPAAYQAIGAAPPIEPAADPVAWMRTAANTGCGLSELYTEAYQMDSVYTQFYKDRNLAAHVKNINASVLYTQGFLDGNVKPSQLLNFFNEIDAPKKGFFGQWGHQFPPRDDYKTYEHGWFDHWLQGRDTGVMEGPVVEVMTNKETWRSDAAFPSNSTSTVALHLDASDMGLSFIAPNASADATWVADRRPRAIGGPFAPVEDVVRGRSADEERLVFKSKALDNDLYLSGVMHLEFNATMDGENAYIMAALYEQSGSSRTRIAFGGLSAALRDGFEEYKAVPVGEDVQYRLRFQPREYIVEKGSSLELVLYTTSLTSSANDEAVEPVRITVHTGPAGAGSLLDMPVLHGRSDVPYPWEEEGS